MRPWESSDARRWRFARYAFGARLTRALELGGTAAADAKRADIAGIIVPKQLQLITPTRCRQSADPYEA